MSSQVQSTPNAALNELDIDPASLALITQLLNKDMDISANRKSTTLHGAVVKPKAPSARDDTASHQSNQGNNTVQQVPIVKSKIHAGRDREINDNMHRAAATIANAPISDVFAVKQIEEVYSLGHDVSTHKKLLPQGQLNQTGICSTHHHPYHSKRAPQFQPY